MTYRIVNKTHATLFLEDLGVTLQRAGGIDSACVVTEEAFLSSRDVKKYRTWIRVERTHIPLPTPVKTSSPAKVPTSPPAPAPVPSPTPADQADMTAMHATFREMSDKLSLMVELLAKQPILLAQLSSIPGHASSGEPSVVYQAPPREEMFIPNSILPKDAESRISVKETESDDGDFEASAVALRNLRRK